MVKRFEGRPRQHVTPNHAFWHAVAHVWHHAYHFRRCGILVCQLDVAGARLRSWRTRPAASGRAAASRASPLPLQSVWLHRMPACRLFCQGFAVQVGGARRPASVAGPTAPAVHDSGTGNIRPWNEYVLVVRQANSAYPSCIRLFTACSMPWDRLKNSPSSTLASIQSSTLSSMLIVILLRAT